MPIAYMEAYFVPVTASALTASFYTAIIHLWQAFSVSPSLIDEIGNLIIYSCGSYVGSWFIAMIVGALPYMIATRYAHRHQIISPLYYLAGSLLTTMVTISILMYILTNIDPRDATSFLAIFLKCLPISLLIGTTAGLTAWLWLRHKLVFKNFYQITNF